MWRLTCAVTHRGSLMWHLCSHSLPVRFGHCLRSASELTAASVTWWLLVICPFDHIKSSHDAVVGSHIWVWFFFASGRKYSINNTQHSGNHLKGKPTDHVSWWDHINWHYRTQKGNSDFYMMPSANVKSTNKKGTNCTKLEILIYSSSNNYYWTNILKFIYSKC